MKGQIVKPEKTLTKAQAEALAKSNFNMGASKQSKSTAKKTTKKGK